MLCGNPDIGAEKPETLTGALEDANLFEIHVQIPAVVGSVGVAASAGGHCPGGGSSHGGDDKPSGRIQTGYVD